jgi:YHS domain-containing protein
MKHQDSERTFKHPVCGMEVSRLTTIQESTTIKGKTYDFCSGGCREAFEAVPEKYYIQHHHQHRVKQTIIWIRPTRRALWNG